VITSGNLILTVKEDGITANHVPSGHGTGTTSRGMKEQQVETMLGGYSASDGEIAETVEKLRLTKLVEFVLP
jgi:hypothetical protein